MDAAMNGTVLPGLHEAIVDKDVVEVQRLLATGGIDVNAIGEYEKRPLHVAAEIGNLDIVRALLEHNPTGGNLGRVDVNAADTMGNTPLHYAVEKGHEVVVRELMARENINPNAIAEDNNSKTPLHIAAEMGKLGIVQALLSLLNLDIVRALLEHNPTGGNLGRVDINAADTMGNTPLHYAVENGHEAVVRELLARVDINPNAIAEKNDSKTPLHIAAEKGRLEIVQALLNSAHKIEVNARDRLGSTALHHAAGGENVEVVEELLSYCKIHGFDNAPKNNRRASPLHLAALFGRHKIVSKLVAAGLPVNKTALSRHTPLHFAVQSGSWETVKVLLKESEDLKVSEADWKGHPPVEYARQACMTNMNGFRPESLPRQESPREDAQRMMQMLEAFDVEGLRHKRQSSIDAANAILVGAALIAGIAFASWLQPPLGFQPTYSSQFLELSSAAPPNTYRPFVYFQSNAMKAFWIFNSMSFFFAIGSFLLGAAAGFPTRFGGQVETNHLMFFAVIRASYFLIVAVACIVGAFICAGFADLPAIPQNWGYMLATAVAGAFPCVFGMREYLLKIHAI